MTLNDLVTILASRHAEGHKVIDRVTGMPETVTRIRAALLDELADSAGTTTGNVVGAGGKASIPIDMAVIELQQRISGELIGDMLRLGVHSLKYGTLAELLLAWHQAFRDANPSPAEEAPWIEQLAEWETAIRAIVEPSKTREVTDACKICGDHETWIDDERKTMLTITYREDSPAETAELICHKCGRIAEGPHAILASLGIKKVRGYDTHK